jgi:hypothetical protein
VTVRLPGDNRAPITRTSTCSQLGAVKHGRHACSHWRRIWGTASPRSAFDEANGGGVGWYEDKGAYHLYLLATEAPIARLKPTGTSDEVRIAYWSHRRKWEDIDDMGGCILPLDQALEHVAINSIFWTWS